MKTPYEKGRDARRKGKHEFNDNPWHYATSRQAAKASEWVRGWRDEDKAMTANQ